MVRVLSPRLTVAATLAVLVAMLISPGLAAEQTPADPGYWLQRLGPAVTKTPYKGVFVYARGDQISSMQIAHRYHEGVVEERLLMQDGEVGEIVRRGMNVVCVLPRHGRLELNNAIPSGPFSKASASQLVSADRWYHPEIAGRDRIAGHDVVKLELNARDTLRYSHQLWLEESTGLPLKGKVLSVSGDVLEYFHFTSLTISKTLPDEDFTIQSDGREVSRKLLSQSPVKRDQNMEGWSVGWTPDGFLPSAAPRSGNGEAVAFSDGFASFSVFVETVAGAEMPSGASRIGATTIYMQRLKKNTEDFLVTVVGEIPLETALKIAGSVNIKDSVALGAM